MYQKREGIGGGGRLWPLPTVVDRCLTGRRWLTSMKLGWQGGDVVVWRWVEGE